jgi:hypothetical protein
VSRESVEVPFATSPVPGPMCLFHVFLNYILYNKPVVVSKLLHPFCEPLHLINWLLNEEGLWETPA